MSKVSGFGMPWRNYKNTKANQCFEAETSHKGLTELKQLLDTLQENQHKDLCLYCTRLILKLYTSSYKHLLYCACRLWSEQLLATMTRYNWRNRGYKYGSLEKQKGDWTNVCEENKHDTWQNGDTEDLYQILDGKCLKSPDFDGSSEQGEILHGPRGSIRLALCSRFLLVSHFWHFVFSGGALSEVKIFTATGCIVNVWSGSIQNLAALQQEREV